MEMLSVKCKDQYGNSIDFNKDNNYTIIEITGINPIKSQINTSTIIDAPGSLFNYSYIENRNIILYVAIDDYGSDARMRLNKMFRTGTLIDLFFNEYSIQGYVESNEYNAFDKKIITQISLVCVQPYFVKNNPDDVIQITNVENLFHFPYQSISSGIEMSRIINFQYPIGYVFNKGEFKTGCIFQIEALETMQDIAIYNLTNNQIFKFDANYTLNVGDSLVIDTRFNNKSVRCNGIDVYNNVVYNSDWIELDLGMNEIKLVFTSSYNHIPVFSVKKFDLFGGI